VAGCRTIEESAERGRFEWSILNHGAIIVVQVSKVRPVPLNHDGLGKGRQYRALNSASSCYAAVALGQWHFHGFGEDIASREGT
jgi:hypothetical protein